MLTVKQNIEKIFLSVFRLIPLKQNRIAFICYNCTQYSCNPKYITEYLYAHYGDRFELVWYYDKDSLADMIPDYVKKYKKNSLGYFITLSTAAIIVSNVTLPRVVSFRKEQKKINTWHGTAFKGDNNSHGNDYNRFDLFLAENELTCNVLRKKNSFNYHGEICKIGMPRNDLLIKADKEKISKVKKKLGIKAEEKMLLYAPTFRETKGSAPFHIDFESLKDSLRRRFGGEWIIAFRYHHMQEGRSEVKGSIDLSSYPDMQELLLVTDVLVTDYSSSMWDFSLKTRKDNLAPVLLYTEDYDQYVSKERGNFFYPYEKLPFPIARNNKELSDCIERLDEEFYIKAVEFYHAQWGRFNYKGNATARFVKDIILKNKDNE